MPDEHEQRNPTAPHRLQMLSGSTSCHPRIRGLKGQLASHFFASGKLDDLMCCMTRVLRSHKSIWHSRFALRVAPVGLPYTHQRSRTMDPTSIISAVSAGLGATFRVLEKGFEINAVDDQAKSVLQTVEQVSVQLKDATTLRRQKSSLFTRFEKRMIDDTIRYTEDAISLVATLVEPARADLEVSGGSIAFPTRLLFVLRDSPRIQVCLTQLGIASQSLNRDLTMLCSREGRPTMTPTIPQLAVKSSPPSYEEVVFLTERRQRNLRRRSSALSLPSTLRTASAASTASLAIFTQEERLTEGRLGEKDPEPSRDSTQSDQGQARHRLGCGRQRSLRWLETRAE